MQIFQVGGAVRDSLMGLESKDRDWVVVGSTIPEMLEAGYRQVGADFPVFLHPDTQEEYALARQDRKAGAGYHGFSVTTNGVTLEEDLARRDLTINAMARSLEGQLIDPYDGQGDLAAKLLRHVGPAFSEDPLRILRVLRFQARFGPEWRIHLDTAALMEAMVAAGEAAALVPERIWKEIARALMEPHPELFVSNLARFGLLHQPSFKSYSTTGGPLLALANAAQQGASLPTRFALAFGSALHGKPQPGIPAEVLRVSVLFATTRGAQAAILEPHAHPEVVFDILQRACWFKENPFLEDLLAAWESLNLDTRPFRSAAHRALEVDTAAITSDMRPGPAVGRAIRDARIAAIRGA